MPTHTLGPTDGTLHVHTYREGVAQKVGHDLIIEVEQWDAAVDVGDGGGVSSVTLQADSRSLQIRDGLHGFKPLSDRDRRQIRKNIDKEILLGRPIAFRSSAVHEDDGQLSVSGELEIAGSTRPAAFELDMSGGRARGTLPVTIRPGVRGSTRLSTFSEIPAKSAKPPRSTPYPAAVRGGRRARGRRPSRAELCLLEMDVVGPPLRER